MGREKIIQSKILGLAWTKGINLWRNNRGMFLTLDGSRKVRAGLEADGSADLIGILPVEVTADMVGKTLGVFVAIEVKSETGRLRDDQETFLRLVSFHGGIAGVCRSIDDFKKIIGMWDKK